MMARVESFDHDPAALMAARERLLVADYPIIIAGHGALASRDGVRRFSYDYGAFVVTTLHGCGVMSYSDPRWLGMIGSWGHPSANAAVKESDCLVVLGARLDPRQVPELPPRTVIRVDIDPGELAASRIPVTHPFHMPVTFWLEQMHNVSQDG
jgi:acetolactate synthase-1/2/3 large subunit